ncbi:MAG: cytoplasmic protein [Planctomycetaceae bacterium]|nr:cytoplasmic protein [Planctomycetaceae bacterium]
MKNRQEILSSRLCGCFSCLAIFPPDEVVDWTDDDQTAICPRCPVDSVIGSASGFPIEKDFLAKMHKRWFEYR